MNFVGEADCARFCERQSRLQLSPDIGSRRRSSLGNQVETAASAVPPGRSPAASRKQGVQTLVAAKRSKRKDCSSRRARFSVACVESSVEERRFSAAYGSMK